MACIRLSHFLTAMVLALAASVAAIPAPTEYTLDMLKQDLQGAHLVALCEVLDTAYSPSSVRPERLVTFKVLECYKGGVSDSVIRSMRVMNMVGAYSEYYEIGLKTIVCFYDGWNDGVYLHVNPRGKFDITDQDSVVPPPVGYGFSDEFDYYQTSASFKNLVTETIRTNEFIQFAPVLPRENQPITFKTSIFFTGGQLLYQLLYATLDHQAGSLYIGFRLEYQPCTSQVCSAILIDTAITLGTLPPGSYRAFRSEYLPVQSWAPATDSVFFTVYAAAGIEQGKSIDGPELTVFPNPLNSSVNIAFANQSKRTDISIYSADGRRVRAFKDVTGEKVAWNAQGLPAGVYLLRAGIGNKTFINKIILAK